MSGQSNSEQDDIPVRSDARNDDDVLPAQGLIGQDKSEVEIAPDLSSVPPAAGAVPGTPIGLERDLPAMPTPFTPSIERTLGTGGSRNTLEPLPDSLSVAIMRARLDGKKKIKCVILFPWYEGTALMMVFSRGALLTPKEMENLTNSWRPYRSVGEWLSLVECTLLILLRGVLYVVLSRTEVDTYNK